MSPETISFDRQPSPGMERRARSFRPAVAFAFLAGMAIILIVGWLSYRTTTTLIEDSSWTSHTQDVITNLDQLQSTLEHAESSQGRYLITGDETFLKNYELDVRTTRELSRNLLQLTSDNATQQLRLKDLQGLIEQKIDHMNLTLVLRRNNGLTEDVQRRVATEGKRRMDEIQTKVSEGVALETRLLSVRIEAQRRSAGKSLRSILTGGLLAMLFLAAAGLVLQRDIQKRFAVERQLQRTTALQRAVLNSANYAIISTDTSGTIISFNSAAEQMLGYHASEVVGRLAPEKLHDPTELEQHAEQMSRFFGQSISAGFESLIAKARLGTIDESEWTYVRRDGSRFFGLLSTSAMHDENGAITGYVFIVSDVTRRKDAEKAKSQIERRYRALLQNSSDMVAVIDAAGHLQYISPAVERLLEFEVQELVGREIFDIIHPADVETARTSFYSIALTPGYSAPQELRLRRADGEYLTTEIVANNLLTDEVLHGIVLNARDITERSRARAQLEVQNAVARVLAEAENLDQSIPEILQALCNNLDWELSEFWGVDPEQDSMTFNFAWSLPGIDLSEFLDISQHTRIQRGEGLAGRVWEKATAIQVPDITQEENFVRKIEVEALSLKTAVGFPIRSREGVIGVFTLFSMRHRHVDNHLLSMLNTVGAQIGQFIARKRAEQEITQNEDRYHYLFENSADLILTFGTDGTILHPNSTWMSTLGYSREELLKKPLFDLIGPEDRERCKAIIGMIVRSGSTDKVELTFRSQDGRKIVVEGTISCRYGITGVEYCSAIFQDVTKRREVDRMKNEFISVVSHELRTPLTSIRGSLGLLAGGALRKDPEKADRMLDIALKNTERLVRLINDILDIEKIESGNIALNVQPLDAADLISQASATMHAMADANKVRLETHSTRGILYADRDRMLQTLTNLLSNAIKFSKPDNTVTISSQRRGGGLLIRVRDQGRGIPSNKLQTIFERFQQVDASDSRDKGGTGLGLAICRSIVQQHGGSIWVDSIDGKGSEFFILLPRFQEEDASIVQADASPGPTSGAAPAN
ncbi:multi-sensor signal transduction histidine kinase [Candidatus Koribacter versatilis Ellin345]|uniref:histidine kinase n=1 Tax=Koribacter versatilis (strain Ellin345) TaxID=204669 RepID=Q1IKU6_KORVE|nr:PAS domain S-box protein [Candidatus Koribacter versatilis]ABF42504.1 multi-sensor signal transduction histidine kinase [Candidatus Koribacter versatilis Ellin345]